MTERHIARVDALRIPDGETYSGIKLATNDDLDLVCAVIESIRPDWDTLSQTVSQISDTAKVALHGRLAEEHTRSLLEYLAQTDLFKDVLHPVSLSGKRTKNYHFKDSYAYYKGSIDAAAEYDNILIVNGLPTVVEVKAKSNKKTGTTQFQKLFQENWRNDFFRPLQEYFQTDTFGFVVVTVPERILSRSTSQNKFRRDGGKIVAMNTTLDELKEHAGRIVIPSLALKPISHTVYSITSSRKG